MLASLTIVQKSSTRELYTTASLLMTHDFSRRVFRESRLRRVPVNHKKNVMERRNVFECCSHENSNCCHSECRPVGIPPLSHHQEQNIPQESIPIATIHTRSAPTPEQTAYASYNYNWGPYYCPQPTVLQPYLSYGWFHRPEFAKQQGQRPPVTQEKQWIQKRCWQTVTTDKAPPGFNFTVMSYNVLAQDLVDQHPYLYMNHQKQYLKWELRWENIMKEFKQLKPDILCLQEIQKTHLYLYRSFFEGLGYKGIYKQRTGIRTDGCAIFYKERRFQLQEHTSIEFNQPNCPLLDRDNVAIIAKFAPKSHTHEEFLVATTHLLYNPKRQDVRLAQTQLLLTEVDRIAFREHQGESISYIPVIITGDLNSSPDSVVYQLIVRGQVQYEHLTPRSLKYLQGGKKHGKDFLPKSLRITDQCQHADLLTKRRENVPLSRNEELELIELRHSEWESDRRAAKQTDDERNQNLFASGTLSHKFPLKSVYSHASDGVLEGTTYQDEWLTVDYIFYSTKKLTLLEKYRLPTEQELANTKIPNEFLGSDHLCLLAKFKLNVK